MDDDLKLNLPKTKFKMQGNAAEYSKYQSNKWYNNDIYIKMKQLHLGKPKFILHSGPAYSNGPLHIGHLINNLLKNITALSQHMINKKRVTFLTGHDCHGLPIEIALLKQNIITKDHSIKHFRSECNKFANHWIIEQRKQMLNMGLICSKDYYTTKDNYLTIYKTYSELLLKNLILVNLKSVPWSISEGTTISDSEIEYRNKKTRSVYIALTIVNGPIKNLHGKSILVWTTTPWTLLDNWALAINPDAKYLLFSIEYDNNVKKEFIISEECFNEFVEIFTQQFEVKFEQILSFSGKVLVNTVCEHPAVPIKDTIIFESSDVVANSGTGVVHKAPAHGIEDYEFWKKISETHPAPNFTESVNEFGYFDENIPYWGGKYIFDDDIIFNLLDDKILLIHEIEHSYPYSVRATQPTPVIYRATPQVFLDLTKFKNNVKKITQKIKTYTPTLASQISEICENRSEWLLSRQRTWGVPLATFYNKHNCKILISSTLQSLIIEKMQQDPEYFLTTECIEILKKVPREELEEDFYIENYSVMLGVFDVWFDAGCTFLFKILNNPEHTTTDLIKEYHKGSKIAILEGVDQKRGWFQALLIISFYICNDVLTDIISHGFVVDEYSNKMSKSRGNVISANEILDNYGIDIANLLILLGDYSSEIKVGLNIIESNKITYRRFRNIFRHLLAISNENINYKPVNINSDKFLLEQAVLHRLYLLRSNVKTYISDYEYPKAFKELKEFIEFLSSIYLETRKDIIYCGGEQDEVINVCRIILSCLLEYTAPFLPLLCEEIYSFCNNKAESIFIHNFEEFNYQNSDSYDVFEATLAFINGNNEDEISIISMIENMRQSGIVTTNESCSLILPVNVKYQDLIKLISRVAYIEHGTKITVQPSKYSKCPRCWMYNSITKYCDRCTKIMNIN